MCFNPQIQQSQGITIKKNLGPPGAVLPHLSGFYRCSQKFGAGMGSTAQSQKFLATYLVGSGGVCQVN